MIKLLLILPILFEAISEGLYLKGLKTLSKQIQMAMIASWFLCWAVIPFAPQAILIYILLRFATFNYIHNLSAGLPLNYLGTTSFVDRILVWLTFKQWWYLILMQGICLVVVWCVITGRL